MKTRRMMFRNSYRFGTTLRSVGDNRRFYIWIIYSYIKVTEIKKVAKYLGGQSLCIFPAGFLNLQLGC